MTTLDGAGHDQRRGQTMTPNLRKLALTIHLTASIGWIGAAAAFLALAITALISADADAVRAMFRAMELLGWVILVPVSLLSLVTGIIQALGTPWGLTRHSWVIATLVINVVAVLVLLGFMFNDLAPLVAIAENGAFTIDDLVKLKDPAPVTHAAGGLALLLTAAALSVYKPRGTPRHARRQQRAQTKPT
jgi:hypothetical protein